MYGREVRDCIRLLRQCGEPITIGASGIGYIHLEDQHDDHARAVLVKAHRERTRSYLIDAAALMRQIGKMTATEAAQACLFDLLVPSIEGAESDRPVTMADLARLPDPKYRAGVPGADDEIPRRSGRGSRRVPRRAGRDRGQIRRHVRLEKRRGNAVRVKELMASVSLCNG